VPLWVCAIDGCARDAWLLAGGLNFFVDVVVTGAILGVGLSGATDRVAAPARIGFVENRGRSRLCLDYGLVEFSWERRPGSDGRHTTGFVTQAHRLPSSTPVTATFVDRYGPSEPRLRFVALDGELERLGYRLEDITGARSPGWRKYWLTESQTSILVAAGPSMETPKAGKCARSAHPTG